MINEQINDNKTKERLEGNSDLDGRYVPSVCREQIIVSTYQAKLRHLATLVNLIYPPLNVASVLTRIDSDDLCQVHRSRNKVCNLAQIYSMGQELDKQLENKTCVFQYIARALIGAAA